MLVIAAAVRSHMFSNYDPNAYLDLERTRIASRIDLRSVPAVDWMHPHDAVRSAVQGCEHENGIDGSPLFGTFHEGARLTHETVAKALHSDDSPLWALLVYLSILANLGMKAGFLAGPIGCGKTFSLVSFVILDFLLGDARTCVLCQQNHPLDTTTQQAFDAPHLLGKVVRVVSVTKDKMLGDGPESPWHKCCRRSSEKLTPSAMTGNVLGIATTSLACSTFQGAAVMESNQWRFAISDEAQVLATREAGMVGHLLRPDGMVLWVGDKTQQIPYEPPMCRNTRLGQILRDSMAGVWALKMW